MRNYSCRKSLHLTDASVGAALLLLTLGIGAGGCGGDQQGTSLPTPTTLSVDEAGVGGSLPSYIVQPSDLSAGWSAADGPADGPVPTSGDGTACWPSGLESAPGVQVSRVLGGPLGDARVQVHRFVSRGAASQWFARILELRQGCSGASNASADDVSAITVSGQPGIAWMALNGSPAEGVRVAYRSGSILVDASITRKATIGSATGLPTTLIIGARQLLDAQLSRLVNRLGAS